VVDQEACRTVAPTNGGYAVSMARHRGAGRDHDGLARCVEVLVDLRQPDPGATHDAAAIFGAERTDGVSACTYGAVRAAQTHIARSRSRSVTLRSITRPVPEGKIALPRIARKCPMLSISRRGRP